MHEIYEKFLDTENDYSMHKVIEKLGEAIVSLIQLAAIEKRIVGGIEKKKFVMENVNHLSRLMDNGISGEENNIHKEVSGFDFLTDTNSSFQEEFVYPMADQMIESLWGNTNQFKS